MKKLFMLFIMLFNPCILKSGGLITEIINNTDSEVKIVRVGAESDVKLEILSSDPAKRTGRLEVGRIIIPARSKHIVHNLKIPNIDVDDLEKGVGAFQNKGIHLLINMITSGLNPNHHIAASNPILMMRQKGSLLSVLSYCGAIKSFDFLGEKHFITNNPLNAIIGEYISDESSHTLEINELIPKRFISKRRGSFYAYNKNSLEVNLRRNTIDSISIKSELSKKYPIARILSYEQDKKPISSLIQFDKVVTDLFMHKFCEQVKRSNLGTVISLIPAIHDDKSSISLMIYSKVDREELQKILNHINEELIPQYDE